jgi:hypothetical protein
MTDLSELTKILKLIPVVKLNEIISYISKKETSKLSLAEMESSLSVNSSDMKNIKKLFRTFDNANLYSLLIRTFLEKKFFEDKIMSKLVITSNIYHPGVSSTFDEIFRMLHAANNKIIIVGYWVYDFPKFFETLQEIQTKNNHSVQIEFYFDSTTKWKKAILKNWPIGYAPKIYGINTKQDKSKVKKMKRLHAKMIIVDDKECLITSANLTKNAMEVNIEAGIWTCDKKIIEDSINVLKELKNEGTIIEV